MCSKLLCILVTFSSHSINQATKSLTAAQHSEIFKSSFSAILMRDLNHVCSLCDPIEDVKSASQVEKPGHIWNRDNPKTKGQSWLSYDHHQHCMAIHMPSCQPRKDKNLQDSIFTLGGYQEFTSQSRNYFWLVASAKRGASSFRWDVCQRMAGRVQEPQTFVQSQVLGPPKICLLLISSYPSFL